MKLFSTLAIAASLLLVAAEAICQPFTGKPTYKIEAKRAGVPIGDIHIELFPLIAPLHVANFDNLVDVQFYDSTAFHRVIPGFMIQGGDPNSRSGPVSTWGTGQPGQPTVNAEFSNVSHVRGILSAARSNNINSATSQFFICVAAATHLDNNYSAYGRVTSGMAVVDDIVNSPRNSSDRPLQKIEMFITRTGSNDSVPAAPNLIAPANGFAGAQPSQGLTWAPVTDAALYHLQVSTDPAFGSMLFDEEIKQTATSFELSGLQPQTQYHWRMRTNNGGHLSAWSAAQSFLTGLEAPTLLSPPNLHNSAGTSTELTWQPITGADSYRVLVATAPLFTPSSIVVDSGGIANPSLLLNDLVINQTYFWKVLGQQNGADGFFSQHWRFKVIVVGVHDDNAAIQAVKISPNPAADKAILHFSLTNPGDVTVKLLDLNGRLIKTENYNRHETGENNLPVNISSLVPGVYMIQISGNDFTITRKLVVAK